MTASVAAGHAGSTRLPLHALANVLLGAAVGLLAYYGVTNVVNASDQSALRSQFSAVLQAPAPAAAAEAPVELDFSEWGALDAAYWGDLPLGGAFGRIVIPRIDLDVVVVKGTRTQDLRRGPGWIVRTDVPGATGNVGISGHRTTYGHPFGRINELVDGDTIDIHSPYRRYRYQVFQTLIVAPNRIDVIAHTEEPQLTLTACHPPYSARQRIVVQARLVDVRRTDGK